MGKEELMQLIKQKDQIQRVIAQLTEEIQQIDKAKHFQKGVIDRQGFPRQDVDFGELANFRNLKRKRAQLNNDHVKLMKQIESKLFDYHASLPRVQPEQQQVIPNFTKNKQETKKPLKQEKIEPMQQQKYEIQYLTPFAKISFVQTNSPAFIANIKVNDLLSEFSQVNIYTPDNIKQIPHYVKENQQIRIVVMRPVDQHSKGQYQKVFTLKDKNQYAKVELKIVPQKWAGRGLIGCKIDPL